MVTPLIKQLTFILALLCCRLAYASNVWDDFHPLYFSRCDEEMMLKFSSEHKNCLFSPVGSGKYLVLEDDDFDCGTAGCASYLYENGKRKNNIVRLQCETYDEHLFICHQNIESFSFKKTSPQEFAEAYQNPFKTYTFDNHYLVLDLQEGCFTDGCFAVNYKLQSDKMVKGNPSVFLICQKPKNDTVLCETKELYDEKNSPEFQN